ncbi:MAG TPA: hypothetical protein VJ183_13770 [Chloroflexia bacterium]|nr:hypothetical protein [Chloroflexia bacterium]
MPIKVSKNFRSKWALVNARGALAGGITWFFLYDNNRYSTRPGFFQDMEIPTATWLVPLFAMVMTGIVSGVSGWLLLRLYLPNLTWWGWVSANVIGLATGLLAVGAASLPCGFGATAMNFGISGIFLSDPWSSDSVLGIGAMIVIFGSMFVAMFAGVAGLIIGIAQSVVLRRYLPDTGLWPIVTTFSLGCGGVVGGVLFWLGVGIISTFTGKLSDPTVLAIVSWAIIGAVHGAISGGALRSLFEDEPYDDYMERVKSLPKGSVE